MREPDFSEQDWKREQQQLERQREMEEREERREDYEPLENELDKEWRCLCQLTLPRWGANTVDGYVRCNGCKRVYTKEGVLLEDWEPINDEYLREVGKED